jgi:hypothetical protein
MILPLPDVCRPHDAAQREIGRPIARGGFEEPSDAQFLCELTPLSVKASIRLGQVIMNSAGITALGVSMIFPI